MRKTAFILPFLVLSVFAPAQGLFKTIIPSVPVVAGESFRVQYFIEDASVITDFTAPDFQPFKLVAGPDIYPGEKNHQNNFKQSKNYVFTLVAAMPGKYIIPGAIINSNSKLLTSNEVRIEIISKENAIQLLNKEQLQVSEYYLRPGEDVNEKIRQNLFLKIMVDKRSCFVGEPVVATFKLYSRLESKSDIIKNPGFYGFTVYDMIGLGDKQLSTEYVNGRPFDVHTIRKVQLYPLQAGRFTIDPMEVKNKVEFSRSIVNKKTEQKIVEGVLNDEADIPVSGAEIVETEMSTSPVTIDVKPVPEKTKPATYSGATGRFTIMASLEKSILARNEEGFLVITISGKGNFIQLEPPSIQWPGGVEGFSPVVNDSTDKTQAPLKGKRQFRYGFVCGTPGNYLLPAISFSFFDPDSNKFKTVFTSALQVSASTEETKTNLDEEKKTSIAEQSEKTSRIAVGIVMLLVLVILAYWAFRKKDQPPVIVMAEKPVPAAEEVLQGVIILQSAEDKEFYKELFQAIWTYFTNHIELTGSAKNKANLLILLKEKGARKENIDTLSGIFSACEAGMYTNVSLKADREMLLQKTKEVLEEIEKSLF
ncbi:MAG: protein BatD [Chitinophagaceae bacterium]|nr:protein BatD [Chitinophagaceae bacterium]